MKVLLTITTVAQLAFVFWLLSHLSPAPITGMTQADSLRYQARTGFVKAGCSLKEAGLNLKLKLIEKGASQDEVRQALGLPVREFKLRNDVVWYYSTDADNRTTGRMGDRFKILILSFRESKLMAYTWSIPDID